MKYANQISFVLAALGIGVVAYAISLTFLSPPPAASVNLEELRKRAVERIGSEVPATLTAADTTATGATGILGAPNSRPKRQVTNRRSTTAERTSSAPSERTASAGAAEPSGGQRGRQSAEPQMEMPKWLGDRSAAVPRGRRATSALVPPAPDQDAPPAPPPDSAGSFPNNQMVRPPMGVEGAKRDSTTDPEEPPVRSSMPRL